MLVTNVTFALCNNSYTRPTLYPPERGVGTPGNSVTNRSVQEEKLANASSSLLIGKSFLPDQSPIEIDQLIENAARAIEDSPEVAAEITLATTDQVLNRFMGPQEPLRTTLTQMVARLCAARDHSMHQ
jgi:hypothetical protein